MKIHVQSSPLRYPGGKQVLSNAIARIIEANGLEGCVYAEPYAGGAGAALTLLYSEHASKLWINDADPCIFSFWRSVLNRTEEFLRLVRDTPLTIAQWRRQRERYRAHNQESQLRVGFATFYLNRTNRSGIISDGGVIGGLEQKGRWKMDARFNRSELIRRLSRVALYRDRITVTNMDALDFMRDRLEPLAQEVPGRVFAYLDPPYWSKGSDLYLNYYTRADHEALASYLRNRKSFLWILTYDRSRSIVDLYRWARQFGFRLPYSAHRRRDGRELLVVARELNLPNSWRVNI